MLNFLLDLTPSKEAVYDDRSTAMVIMVIMIAILVIAVFVILCALLGYRRMYKDEQEKSKTTTTPKDIIESEMQVISEYRKLDDKEKDFIKTTLQTLNSNHKE